MNASRLATFALLVFAAITPRAATESAACGAGSMPGSRRAPAPKEAAPGAEADLRTLTPDERKALLEAREEVWRAWFANDQAKLEKLIPQEVIAINAGEDAWQHRDAILDGAKGFAGAGGRLKRLEFPQTELQVYGTTAILYSKYLLEIEFNGKSSTHAGNATEIFVERQGQWVNSGWHLD